jgi:phage baseplate assembly protein gpV
VHHTQHDDARVKVALNMLGDSWVPWSRMKIRSSHRPTWPATSESATMVIENAVAAMEIVEPGIVASSDRALPAPRTKSHTTPS